MRSLVLLAATLGCFACSSPLDPNAPAWRRVEGAGPPPTTYQGTAYDGAGDRMLIFGGTTAKGETAAVWSFDLAAEQWTKLPTGSGPAPRANPGVILDDARHRLVTFGGRTGLATMFGDAWALDLDSLTWTQLPSGPPGRQRPHAATDGERAWFFGGEGLASTSSDLWQLDLTTDAWTQLPTGGDGPGARTCGAFAYDDGGLVLVGGHSIAILGGTYRYDLAAQRWSTLAPKGNPTAGAHWAYATDTTCNRLYLVAGDHDDHYDTSLSDALALDGSAFAHVSTSTLPPERDHATAIVDPVRHQLVLFGGGLNDGESYLGDTWILPLAPCP